MENKPDIAENAADDVVNPSYEAPRIENVLTPEELEREVAYAGISGHSVAPAA